MIEIPQAAEMPVWRYLSFGRFVWLLQKKALWLSRGDLLGDAWEGAFSTAQIATLLEMAASDIGPTAKFPTKDAALLDFAGFAAAVPRTFYANCWTCRPDESHAMWRVYCQSTEGVAIQTTIGTLRASLPAFVEVLPVGYRHGEDDTLDPLAVATQKRRMFAEEREVRLLWSHMNDVSAARINPAGRTVSWDPSDHIRQIRIHPQADDSFVETVVEVVRAFAPMLASVVHKSEMAPGPESAFAPLISRPDAAR